MMQMKGRTNLLQIVGATRPTRRFASHLNCGQQQSNEDADNRNDDKEFDKSESVSFHPNHHPKGPSSVCFILPDIMKRISNRAKHLVDR